MNFKMNIEYIYVLLFLYIVFGILYILFNLTYPPWFFALTLFFGFKWVFNYRKCTISYIEVKLRRVNKEEGYLYRFLKYMIDFRDNKLISIVYIFQILFIAYHFIKTDSFQNI
jgi:hypothetical protein